MLITNNGSCRIAGLDDGDVHTIHRQDIGGNSFSQQETLTLHEKRAQIVSHIVALQSEDNALQGKHGHCRRASSGAGCDSGKNRDSLTIGWLTWTHKGVAEVCAHDEVVLDVTGCQ